MTRLSLGSHLLCSCALVVSLTPALAQSEQAGGDNYEMVVVTASRYEEEARLQQKNALNIVNVQSAEAILKYPDFNAAESLSRIPGISLLSDTGEGRFVNIRGLDGNLNGATYGGIVLLNTNTGGTYNGGGGRAVEFDTIPGGAIDGIIVTKTGSPDHDAEGLGGSVELTPRTAANITKPFAELSLGAGYEPIHDHTGPFNVDAAVGARFGLDASGLVIENGNTANKVNPGWVSNPTPFSIVLDGSWRSDMRGFDDIEEDYTNEPFNPAGPLDKTYQDIQLRHYDYHRRRFGYGGEFDFKPNDEHRYYVRANIFGYIESVIKNHLVYNSLDGSSAYPIAVAPTNANGVATQSDLTLSGTNEEETHSNEVVAIGGEDDFHIVKLDYHAAYSRSTFNVGRNYGSKFTGPSAVFVTYDNITSPNFPGLKITDGTNPNDASQYKLTSFKNSTERDVDQEWSYAGNATVPVDILSGDDALKFGFEARLRTKSAAGTAEKFVTPGSTKIKVQPLLSTLSPLAPDTTYYHGRYTNGPGINEYALLGLVKNGTLVSTGMPPLSTAFSADEFIYAGYGMYTGTYGPWGVLAGVRVESTYAKYGFDDPDTFVIHPHQYTNIFPTVQVRYNLSSDLIARATYSTGIGRPGFTQVAQSTSIDDSNYPSVSISEGNPNLKPTTGNNFDLDLEYYLNDGGILQLGAFDKEFDNYAFSRTITASSDPRYTNPNPGQPLQIHLVTFGNIPTSYARGVEASYQQQFSFLPKPFDGFGFDGNVTYVASSGALRPGEKHSLPGTSPMTFNAGIFYEEYGLNLRIASEYVGHSLYQIGGDRATDVFEDSRFTLDFTSSYDICENASVYFNVKNITNAPLRIYMGSPNWPIQREFYDQTFESGVRLKI